MEKRGVVILRQHAGKSQAARDDMMANPSIAATSCLYLVGIPSVSRSRIEVSKRRLEASDYLFAS